MMKMIGPILLKSEDFMLEADEAFIYFQKPLVAPQISDIKEILFIGKPIKATYKMYNATANRIIFNLQDQTLHLIKALVKNNLHKIVADDIYYNISDDKLQINSNLNSQIIISNNDIKNYKKPD
jgi:lipopolysaccharide export system protein LptA